MKIAIVRLSALGDLVHSMIGLQFIKAKYPDCQIDWLVESRYAELLADHPDIHQVLTLDIKALKHDWRGFNQQLQKLKTYRQHHYDLVIDAQGLLKSAICARLLGAPVAGFNADSIRERAAAWLYQRKIACPYDANTIDRNAKVVSEPLGFSITPEQIHNKQAFLFYHTPEIELEPWLSATQKNVLFVIGSTWPSRNYPAEHFISVANQLKQNSLVLWGNADEKASAEAMAKQSPAIRVLPKLSLNALKALIASVDLVIGNDTGPTHMAWAMNIPSITLFGPTPVSRVYQTAINKVLKSPSEVNPFKLNKQDFSINQIKAEDVVKVAQGLLGLREI